MKIDIITFLCSNSVPYAEFLKETMDRFASGKHKLAYKCVQHFDEKDTPKGWEVVCTSKDYGQNSLNHAMAIHQSFDYIESDIVVFVDVDMAILYQDWDDIVVDNVMGHGFFGTGWGVDEKDKYQGFPNVFFFCTKKEAVDQGLLDFRPKVIKGTEKVAKSKIVDPEIARHMGVPVGVTIKCDTGWLLPLAPKKAGYTSHTMPRYIYGQGVKLPYLNSKQKKKCKQKPAHMAEWHYNKELFITHKQASRNHPLDGEWGSIWKERIEEYIRRENG